MNTYHAALWSNPSSTDDNPGSVVTGRDREVRGAMHNWHSVVRVREGLAGREILVSSRTSDSCGGPCAKSRHERLTRKKLSVVGQKWQHMRKHVFHAIC